MKPILRFLLAATVLTAGAAAPTAGGSTAKPTLKVVKRAPLQVTGARFKSRERVRVIASTDTNSAVRLVRTTVHGTFTVALGNWSGCDTVKVRALGARGDRATIVVLLPPHVETPCWGL